MQQEDVFFNPCLPHFQQVVVIKIGVLNIFLCQAEQGFHKIIYLQNGYFQCLD
jgi:hypothetical protein